MPAVAAMTVETLYVAMTAIQYSFDRPVRVQPAIDRLVIIVWPRGRLVGGQGGRCIVVVGAVVVDESVVVVRIVS